MEISYHNISTHKTKSTDSKQTKFSIGEVETSYKNTYLEESNSKDGKISTNSEDFVFKTPIKSLVTARIRQEPLEEFNKKTCFELRSYRGKRTYNM